MSRKPTCSECEWFSITPVENFLQDSSVCCGPIVLAILNCFLKKIFLKRWIHIYKYICSCGCMCNGTLICQCESIYVGAILCHGWTTLDSNYWNSWRSTPFFFFFYQTVNYFHPKLLSFCLSQFSTLPPTSWSRYLWRSAEPVDLPTFPHPLHLFQPPNPLTSPLSSKVAPSPT